jgi:hypothetical protein
MGVGSEAEPWRVSFNRATIRLKNLAAANLADASQVPDVWSVVYYLRMHVTHTVGVDFVISGNLFTRDYLLDGIERTEQRQLAQAASPHQALRRPSCAGADRLAKSAGKARRPWTSHASTTKSALSPARHRINSSSHRARPTPGTGKGVDGSVDTRHRVADAVGCPAPMKVMSSGNGRRRSAGW